MINDTIAAAELASSSWETMAAESALYEEELRKKRIDAMLELYNASFYSFHKRTMSGEVRVQIAEVALSRIERRMGL